MSSGVIGARLRSAEQAALRAAAVATRLQNRVEVLEAALKGRQRVMSADILKATDCYLGTIKTNLAVAAGVTIDGQDISSLGSIVAGNSLDIVGLQDFAGVTGYAFIPAAAFNNRDARTSGYSNAKHFVQAPNGSISRYHTTWQVPRTIDAAGPNITALVHWLVAAAGGTAGQDVAWRLNTAFTANGESTSTGSASVDVIVDTPTITADTFYISPLSTTISGGVAGDNMTIEINRRTASDTLAAIVGFVGVELRWNPDYL